MRWPCFLPQRQRPVAATPGSKGRFLGTPVLHPSDKNPSPGTPVFHPSDKDPSPGTPVLRSRRLEGAGPSPHNFRIHCHLDPETPRGTLSSVPRGVAFWCCCLLFGGTATSSSPLSLRPSSRVPSWLPSWLPFAYSPFRWFASILQKFLLQLKNV